ncbi:MAG: hypothetical protein NTV34_06585, partial [Proteobacteria bacterium]|nr:hypothetical protein [Pseudomonadota bacterium]
MKYTILSLFLVAASAANAQEQYVSVACRGGGFFSTKTQLFFSSDGFDVQKIPNSLTVSGRRVLAS